MMATPPSHDWTKCPQGEIAGLVDSLKKRRRRKTFQQAAGLTSAIVVLAFVTSAGISGFFRGQTPVQSIACKTVIELAPRYVARQLEADLTAQIDHHLGRCGKCRDRIHAQFPEFSNIPAAGIQNEPCPTTASLQSRGMILAAVYQSER